MSAERSIAYRHKRALSLVLSRTHTSLAFSLTHAGDTVELTRTTLPKGAYVKLRPRLTDFIRISNPKAVLEHTLRNFACLTQGETIRIPYNNREYDIDVVVVRAVAGSPATRAVSIVDADVQVDFEAPADYKVCCCWL